LCRGINHEGKNAGTRLVNQRSIGRKALWVIKFGQISKTLRPKRRIREKGEKGRKVGGKRNAFLDQPSKEDVS